MEILMARRQPSLFPKPPTPRRWRMHVIDAGPGEEGSIAVFRCPRCGRQTDWIRIKSVTEARKGIPCPTCNPAPA